MSQLYDQYQRDTALNIRQSFIVQAPAGSGKTELLIQRYLSLLAHVKEPEQIVAITFTRKAAQEMQHRVIHALEQALLANQGLQHSLSERTLHLAQQALNQDNALNWQCLDNPNRFHILTIDALCARIVHLLPLATVLSPSSAQVTSHPQRYYREAAEQLLSELYTDIGNSHLQTLLLHMDNNQALLQQFLIHILAHREQWLPYLVASSDHPNYREQLENGLKQVIEAQLHNTLQRFPSELRAACIAIAKATDATRITQGDRPIFEDLDLDLTTTADNLPIWLQLCDLLLTKDSHWRRSVTKKQGVLPPSSAPTAIEKEQRIQLKQNMMKLLEACQPHEDLRHALSELRFMPTPNYTDKHWHIIAALCDTLPRLYAYLKLVFQQYNVTDFIEISTAAVTALGHIQDPTELALYFDHQIQHLLIDEFQDTSISQYQLLEKLCAGWQPGDGKSLFIVGDPMQSIYRFRQAEVGLFIKAMHQGVADITLTPLQLQVNFRSQDSIVQWVNTCFKDIFPAEASMDHGAIPYTPAFAFQQSNTPEHLAGVHCHCLPGHSPQQQALYLAAEVKTLRHHNPHDTIAVLVRSRHHAFELLHAFKQQHIPFKAVEFTSFAASPVILDLLSLTQALHRPFDRLAWLSLLRSPGCGLNLIDLEYIAQHSDEIVLPKLEALANDSQLSAEGRARLVRFVKILTVCLERRYHFSTRRWLEESWYRLGGPGFYGMAHDISIAQDYFQLVEELTASGGELDCDELPNLLQQRFGHTESNDDNPVQVMTIHRSKGLEFDTVVIPRLEKRPPVSSEQLLWWSEITDSQGTPHLLLSAAKARDMDHDPIHSFLRHHHSQKDFHETSRLLYVAVTRAKKHLHLCVLAQQPDADTPLHSHPHSFWARLHPVLLNTNLDMHWHSPARPENISTASDITLPVQRLQRIANPQWADSDELMGQMVAQQESSVVVQPQLNWHPAHAELGVFIHSVLETWPNSCKPETVIEQAQLQFELAGFDARELAYALTQVTACLHHLQHSQRAAWLFSPHKDNHHEYALTYRGDKESVQQFIIDKTFIDANDTRWIVDYKTTAQPDEDLAEFYSKAQQSYQPQLHTYAMLMQQLDKAKHPIMLALYYPCWDGWTQWAYQTSCDRLPA